ncbi:MAG: hypothetical protein OCD00_01015 [Colwellia sp.]
MSTIKGFIIVLFMLTFCNEVVAKKRCKPQLAKLQQIQAMQRHGHSLRGGQSLRKREDKARKKWWQCEHSSARKNKLKKKNKNKGKDRSKKRVKKNNKKGSIKLVKAGKPLINSTASPFKTNQVIVVKSKYQGNKKFAWLSFYQQPSRCRQPKNLSIFASCSEDKKAQRLVFEKSYRPEQ